MGINNLKLSRGGGVNKLNFAFLEFITFFSFKGYNLDTFGGFNNVKFDTRGGVIG